MSQTRDDSVPAANTSPRCDGEWMSFESNLAGFLEQMDDPGDGLLLEVPLPGGGSAACAQVRSDDNGRALRAQMLAIRELDPAQRVHIATLLRGAGWRSSEGETLVLDFPTSKPAELAARIVQALRAVHGIAHPQLLTYRAWGPAAVFAGMLDLQASDEVPADVVRQSAPEPDPALAIMPANRAELMGLVRDVIREHLGTDPTIDEDEDIVLTHLDQPVWVRVRTDQPAVEIFARVAHDVHSRRQTAIELGLLNRDRVWVRWVLSDRTVWQQLLIPGMPFAPAVLRAMVGVFLDAMSETRDDLALRLGATVS